MAGEPTNDGSMEAAIAAFPDEALDDAAPVAVVNEPAPVAEAKDPAAAAKVDADADADEDDDDWLEMPSDEEGKPAARHKLTEVWQGFQKAKDLETQLVEARKAQPMPAEIQEHVASVIAERGRYAQALQQWQLLNQPVEPDMELLNEGSTRYDPPAYYKAFQAFQATKANQAKVAGELERVQALQVEQSDQLKSANFNRERARLLEIWPEMKNGGMAETVRTDLEKHYGIDRATLAEVIDSRFYAVAKDALAYRASQAKQAEAVKVVRAKPTLIRGSARPNSNGSSARAADAMTSLRKSGSIDDAMAALDGYKSFG